MQNQQKCFGIYLNTKKNVVMRVNSPYWIPSGGEWVLLTPDVDTTLKRVRELARERGLVAGGENVVWGDQADIGRGPDAQ